jgi:hypothetical protein
MTSYKQLNTLIRFVEIVQLTVNETTVVNTVLIVRLTRWYLRTLNDVVSAGRHKLCASDRYRAR